MSAGAASRSVEATGGTEAHPGEPSAWLPALVAALAVVVGTWLRIRGLSTILPWGDEFHSLSLSGSSIGEILSTYDARGSGIALPLLQSAFRDLLGPTLSAARMPALLGGIGTLALAYPVGRRLVEPQAAALATAAIAVSPILVFYSHFGRAYSLATALGLLLALSLHCAHEGSRRGGWLALAAISVALLPWVHATAAVLPLALGSAALWRAATVHGVGRRLLEVAGCLAVGVLGCVLLYLPAWSSALDFVSQTVGSRSHDRVSIVVALSVLAGSSASAWLLLLGVPAAAVGLGIARRSASLLTIFAAFASVAALWVVSPRGGPYAYARYLLVSLPFALMLASWLFTAIIGRAAPRRFSAAVTLAVGVSAIGLVTVTGHSSPAPSTDGPFAGTYLSLWPLARFDEAWQRAPAFYKELAANDRIERILEVPMTRSRGSLLYRSYYLEHRKETWLGEVGSSVVEGAGIVSLHGAESACQSGADVAIVHVALEQELAGYWKQVYPDSWSWRLPRTFISLARTFESTPLWFRRSNLDALAADFARFFGNPIYRDGLIQVFALDPELCGTPRRGRKA